MKKFLAILMAILMLLSIMALPALADELPAGSVMPSEEDLVRDIYYSTSGGINDIDPVLCVTVAWGNESSSTPSLAPVYHYATPHWNTETHSYYYENGDVNGWVQDTNTTYVTITNRSNVSINWTFGIEKDEIAKNVRFLLTQSRRSQVNRVERSSLTDSLLYAKAGVANSDTITIELAGDLGGLVLEKDTTSEICSFTIDYTPIYTSNNWPSRMLIPESGSGT